MSSTPPSDTPRSKPKHSPPPPRSSVWRRYWWAFFILGAASPIMACGVLSMGVLLLGGLGSLTGMQSKSELPITMTWRKSSADAGPVLIFTNSSNHYLHGVTFTVQMPGGETVTRDLVTFAPHADVNVNVLDLAPLFILSGDIVTVNHPEYLPRQYVIP